MKRKEKSRATASIVPPRAVVDGVKAMLTVAMVSPEKIDKVVRTITCDETTTKEER